MEQEKFILVFASNYHGYYVEDILAREKIEVKLRKAPRSVGKSCQAAIFINAEEITKVIDLVNKCKVKPLGVYEVIMGPKDNLYKKLDVKNILVSEET